ncbi:MAG: CHAT domain-containing protein [Bryobacteraceae bacterium]
MRRTMRLLFAVASCCLPLICQAQGVDRSQLATILNFEAGPAGGSSRGAPRGWLGGPQETIFMDDKIVHSGKWAVRLERDENSVDANGASSADKFSVITIAIPIDFTGTRVELRGFLKTEEVSKFAGLWMREDGDGGAIEFDNMESRHLRGTHEWTEYSIALPLRSEAKQLVFGVLIMGVGKTWADDLQLLVDGNPIWNAPKVEQPKRILDLDKPAGLAQTSQGRAAPPTVVRQAGKLALRQPVERELGPGQIDVFTVDVAAGLFLHVAAEQKGVDLILSMVDPAGREVVSMDSRVSGFEHASAIAKESGAYQVKASPKAGIGTGGAYRIELLALRKPNKKDRARLQAEGFLRSALADDRTGTGESRRRAIAEYTKANSIWAGLKEYAEQALGLTRLGLDHLFLGEKHEALGYFQQTLTLWRVAGDRSGEAATLLSIGLVHSGFFEMQMALDYFEQAASISRAVGDRNVEASTLVLSGGVYAILGEYQEALDRYQRALPIKRALGDRPSEALTLSGIGVVCLALGEKQRALDYFQQALLIIRELGDRTTEAALLSNVGLVYWELNENQKALDCYEQALRIERTVGIRSSEGATLVGVGLAYSALGVPQKAVDYYEQALLIQRASGDRSREAFTLFSIGVAYSALGERQNSLGYYLRALSSFRTLGLRIGEASTLGRLQDLFRQSQPDLAIFLGKEAVNIIQSIRRVNRDLDEQLRRSFEQSFEFGYRSLADLLIENRRFGEAEEVLNLLKDKEAADFIRRDAVAEQLRAATLLDSERKALERYEQILTQIASDGQAKSALVAKAAKTALSDAEVSRSLQLDRDLAAANTVLLRFFDEQEEKFAVNSASAKQIEELRESEGLQDALQALGPDVVAIYTLVLPDKYVALLVTSGARKAYSTAIPELELNRKVFEFRQQLQNPGSDPLPLAKELYKIVFPEGLRQDLDLMGAKTIMWSIDSTIRYVPMAALHDGEQYMVSRFRNSLITPASLTRLAEGSRPLWKGVGFGVSEAKGNFAALPAVPEELRRIFRQAESGDAPVPGRVWLDGDFTREAFEAGMRQPEKSVVHIATHFDSRPGVAANSHLLLGDGSEMSLAEIEAAPRLFSGVDLLTLSACSTAFTNRSEDGREVDSFGTIAQRLGARGVIASLWSVNDEATARVMEAMYRIRQSNPELGKSEALRQAQELMASGVLKPGTSDAEDRGVHVPGGRSDANGWTHPYYWAPFILIGNWR